MFYGFGASGFASHSFTTRGRRAIEAAAPGHVAAVRRLVVDRLTPSQLDAIGEAAAIVLAAFDEPGRTDTNGAADDDP